MFHQLLILCLVAVALGAPKVNQHHLKKLPDGRIVGGNDANIEDYPHQVSLLYFGSPYCCGSIIDETHVMTAAHCTDGALASDFQISAGSSKVVNGGTVINVKKIHQHPLFNSDLIDYDVSVLELAEPLTFGPTISAIGLGDSELSEGVEVEVTGWGSTGDGGDSPEQLQVVVVPIVSREKCQSTLGSEITDRMICAGLDKGGKDSCQGDSGGPLIRGNKQYGITSWGYGCAQPHSPGVYSNVVALRDFINSVIKQN